ncbi:DUF5789 family protein [Natrinema halophilum]|uniref:DUF2795 domain-containing protein n=1 Tax=Natrinema halophilum TaxID=1699371 RepID=A0A7D5K5J5_9EURY|nr:hypothetical protein [Natrinema halophilum]QLG48443.1 hypothetical protein HYG82_06065 [Natrinema halophilum]
MSDDGRSHDRVQDRAEQRKSERAEHTESIFEDVERHLGEMEYPITSEELATEYGDEPIDMPNETESFGDVFDRLVDEQYESPEDVREAVYGEITGEAGSPNEANAERDLEALDAEKEGMIGESDDDGY